MYYAFGMLNGRRADNMYMIGNVFFNLIVMTFMSYVCWRASVILDIASAMGKELYLSEVICCGQLSLFSHMI